MNNHDRELADAIKKAGNAPLLINIVSKRVRQLQRGAKPLIDDPKNLSETEIAILEFMKGKIGYRSRAK